MPVSDELLLKLIYQEENKKALDEATAQLEKMTDAEKELVKQNTKLKESSDETASGFSKMQAGIVTLNAGIGIAETAIATLKKGWDFAKEGAAIERVQTQFDNLAKQSGVDAKQLLANLDSAAAGTVDDDELMQTATRAMALGLTSNIGDLTSLMRIARASSVAFGGDTAAAFQSISNAVENLAPRSLKQAGIIVNLTKAYADYATAQHKVVDQLTDEEKRQALLNQVIDKGADLIKKLGDSSEDTATKMARVETRLKDIGDQIKVDAANVASFFLQAGEAIDVINGHSTAVLIEAAKNSVGKLKDDLSSGKITLEQYNAAVEGLANELDQWIANTGDAIRTNDLMTQGMANAARAANQQKIEMEALGLVNKRYADQIEAGKATDITKLTPEKQAEAAKAFTDYQTKLSDIEAKTADERVKAAVEWSDAVMKLEAETGQKRADIVAQFAADEAQRLSDMRDKQIGILTNYAEAEQQITNQQNQDRLKLAQNYGIETERMEAEHQRSMQRLSEDHGRNLRKLADSRDALAIEDEQETYEINRRRAEEDYQVQAAQKSEDYARQLADQNVAFEQQRQARAKERDKQLADLSEQFAKQDEKYKATYAKQLKDLDKSAEDQRQALWAAEQKKQSDLSIAQAQERAQAETQWTQWRNEHEIFFAGERQLYDDYLKYTADQLKAYIQGGGVTPSSASTSGPLIERRANGGAVNPFGVYTVGEHGTERLYMGRQGGYVAPNMGSITINAPITVPNANASAQEILGVVHQAIVDVVDKAMRQ